MRPIKLLSIRRIQDSHMEKPFSIRFATWRRLAILDSSSRLIPQRVSSAIVTLIFLDFGTRNSHQWIPVQPSHEVDGLSSTQDALFPGLPNFNLKLHFFPPKPSTLLCHRHYAMSFQSWTCYRKWGSEISKSFAPSLMCTARYSRTTLVLWNSQGFPNYTQGPSTSMFAIIIFASMCARVLSRYSLSTPKTRLLTYLPSLWHKTTFNVIVAPCAASNLSQATKVRECYKIRVLWYLLTVLNCSKCQWRQNKQDGLVSLWRVKLAGRECYEIRVLWYLLTVLTCSKCQWRHCGNIPANPSWINDIPLQSHDVI